MGATLSRCLDEPKVVADPRPGAAAPAPAPLLINKEEPAADWKPDWVRAMAAGAQPAAGGRKSSDARSEMSSGRKSLEISSGKLAAAGAAACCGVPASAAEQPAAAAAAALAASCPPGVAWAPTTTPYNPHYSGPPRPPCEDERLRDEAHLLSLLDATPPKELENILQLVCNIFCVRNALIALFGEARIYVLDTVSDAMFKTGDFPWRSSFCAWTLASEQHQVMIVNDARQDARFADNKYVRGAPGVRFYCGAPLVSSRGHRIGTICFADTLPREFDASSLQVLINLSEVVTRELEQSIALAQQQALLAQHRALQTNAALAAEAEAVAALAHYQLLLRTAESVASAVLIVDTSLPNWPVLHANSGWARLLQQLGCGTLTQGAGVDAGAGASCAAGGVDWCCGGGQVIAAVSRSAAGADGALGLIAGAPVTLWSLLDTEQLGHGRGGKGSVRAVREAMMQQVCGRQSFTLCGARLSPALQGVAARLVFRCARYSALEGGVGVCLPTFTADNEGDGEPANIVVGSIANTAAGTGLYFVTVQVAPRAVAEATAAAAAAAAAPASGPNSCSSGAAAGSACSSATSLSSGGGAAVGQRMDDSNDALLPVLDVVPYTQLFLGTTHAEQQWQHARGAGSSTAGSNGDLVVCCSSSLQPPSSTGSAAAGPGGGGRSERYIGATPFGSPEHSMGNEEPVTGDSSEGVTLADVLALKLQAPAQAQAQAQQQQQQQHELGDEGEQQQQAQQAPLPPEQQQSVWSSAERSAGCFASVAAGLVCERIAGLRLGGQIAAGSCGRVFRGDYFGSKVAVKVLDGADVLRRDESTGFSLEALLSERMKHPNLVRTLAWAVITGQGQLPQREHVWGHTLDSGKPSVKDNAAAIASADSNSSSSNISSGASAAQPPQPAAAGAPPAQPPAAGALVARGPPSLPSHDGLPSSGDAAAQLSSELLAPDAADAAAGGGVAEGQTWMVLEYCDRGCLQDACDRGWLRHTRSCLDPEVNLLGVLATAVEVAGAMALLHGADIIHGDLSAYNVMLTSNDPAASIGRRGFVAKVADFGLSRRLSNGDSRVFTKTYGTITHMAQEVLSRGEVSKAADVYSFGVLLYSMVTGSRPWAGMSHSAIVNAVCVQRLRLSFPDDAPEALAMLGSACMAYEPEERPSFSDVLDILQPVQELLLASRGCSAAGSDSGSGSGSGSDG